MEDSKWRFRTRIVGYFNCFLCSLSVTYVFYLSCIAAFVQFPQFMDEDYRDIGTFFVSWIPYFFVLFLNFLAGSHVWSAIQLIWATKIGQDTMRAWQMINLWMAITAYLLILGSVHTLYAIVTTYSFKIVIILIIALIIITAGTYSAMFYIVFQFKFELERILITGLTPNAGLDIMEQFEEPTLSCCV